MRRAKESISAEDGYTLVELMTVVLIIAILLVMALASYIPATSSANAAACRHNQVVFEQAFAVATAEDGVAPDELEDLEADVADFDEVRRCPQDGSLLVLDPATGDVSCPNHP